MSVDAGTETVLDNRRALAEQNNFGHTLAEALAWQASGHTGGIQVQGVNDAAGRAGEIERAAHTGEIEKTLETEIAVSWPAVGCQERTVHQTLKFPCLRQNHGMGRMSQTGLLDCQPVFRLPQYQWGQQRE